LDPATSVRRVYTGEVVGATPYYPKSLRVYFDEDGSYDDIKLSDLEELMEVSFEARSEATSALKKEE
jgi:hypothetical protein